MTDINKLTNGQLDQVFDQFELDSNVTLPREVRQLKLALQDVLKMHKEEFLRTYAGEPKTTGRCSCRAIYPCKERVAITNRLGENTE